MENKKIGIIIAILIILLVILIGMLIVIIKPLNDSAIDIYQKGNKVADDVTDSMKDLAIQTSNNMFTVYFDREIRASDVKMLYSNASVQNIPVMYNNESLSITKIDSTKIYIAKGVYNKKGEITQINIEDVIK